MDFRLLGKERLNILILNNDSFLLQHNYTFFLFLSSLSATYTYFPFPIYTITPGYTYVASILASIKNLSIFLHTSPSWSTLLA